MRISSPVLFSILCSIVHLYAATAVHIYHEKADPKVAFAVQEIESAFETKDRIILLHDLDELTIDDNCKIVLAELSHRAIVERLNSPNVANLDELQPEGYSIRVTSNNNQETYWIIGADAAGAM